jgi:cytochrome c553
MCSHGSHGSRRALRALAATAVVAGALAGTAAAQSAVNGKTLWNSICAGCHGMSPASAIPSVMIASGNAAAIRSAIAANKGGMGTDPRVTALSDAQLADIAAYIANPTLAAQAAVSRGSIDFGAVGVGTTASGTVTLSNTGATDLTVTSIRIAGGAASPFSFSGGGACSGSGVLNAGGNCLITVSFKPTSAAAVTDGLTITHNASGGPITVNLSGGSGSAPPPSGGGGGSTTGGTTGGTSSSSGGGCSIADGSRDASLALLPLAAAAVALRRRLTRRPDTH